MTCGSLPSTRHPEGDHAGLSRKAGLRSNPRAGARDLPNRHDGTGAEGFPPRNDQERAALDQAYAGGRAMLTKWQHDLLAGVPSARIVELPGANLFMFLSNEADVIREIRAFATTLK
jgi:hypothetical protein